MTEKKYDVIIVGGGPAGSTAGYLLANSGIKVLIIDKFQFPREKLCAGLITWKTLRLLERIFDESEVSLKEKGIINYTTEKYEIRYRDKKIVNSKIPIPFHIVERKGYDNFLLNKSKDAGVDVIEGEMVVTCNAYTNEIITSSGRRFMSEFIIGADGVNSIIRKSFPEKHFNHRKWKKNLATALEIFVSRDEVNLEVNHLILFYGIIDMGYAWLFPQKDNIIIGLGGANRVNKGKFMTLFNDFLTYLNVNELKKYKVRGHLLPNGYYIPNPIFKKVLLLGDAGGMVDSITGEGIFYAQRSAEFASWAILKTINEGKNLEKTYMQLLQGHVFPELFNAKFLKGPAYYISKKLHFYPAKIAFHLFSDRLIELTHGLRSYRGMRKIKGLHEEI